MGAETPTKVPLCIDVFSTKLSDIILIEIVRTVYTARNRQIMPNGLKAEYSRQPPSMACCSRSKDLNSAGYLTDSALKLDKGGFRFV
jgi:hypothetical protein